MGDQDQLVEWLNGRCKERGLSWAEASRRAGLSENTISQAAGGVPLGPKRLRALAEFFDVPPEFLFRKAGLLPDQPSEDEVLDEQMLYALQKVMDILAELPPDLQEQLATTIVTQAEAFWVVYEKLQREPTAQAESSAESRTRHPRK